MREKTYKEKPIPGDHGCTAAGTMRESSFVDIEQGMFIVGVT